MLEPVASALSAWESFYVIVGSSGAALTGLQFVVIALVADMPRQSSTDTIGAFATPTIVHFGVVLLVAAILSAPWPGLVAVGALIAVIGACGLGYSAVIIRRARGQTGYVPVFEDWLWHTILPTVAYLALAIGGATLAWYSTGALFAIAAVSVLLLFIGIHNAWDTVTYLVVGPAAQARRAKEE
jgi:hypothetical protein